MAAGLALLIVPMLVRRASVKPFWHDEIYTILLSRLPSIADIWKASAEGVDLAPPLNTILTHSLYPHLGTGPVALRLPALLGFSLMLACIFTFAKRRAGATAAIAAVCIPLFSAGQRYALEARGYGLMMGFTALALLCWSEAARGRRSRFLLGALALGMAGSIWAHYYGVLGLAAVFLGELARTVRRRSIDWPIVAAMATAAVTTLPLVRLAVVAAEHREAFWARTFGAGDIVEAYRFLFQPLIGTEFLVLAVVVAVLALTGLALGRGAPPLPGSGLPLHEMVALAGLVFLPFLGLALGWLVTGVFVPRYLLSTIIGVSIAFPLCVWKMDRHRAGATLMLAGFLLFLTIHSVVLTFRPALDPPADPFAPRALLIEALREAPPTIVAGNIQFLQLWFYAPPALKSRIHYLIDPVEARARTGTDTVDRGYAGLARWRGVPAEDYSTFVGRHEEFNVYVAGGNWLLEKLRDDGVTLEERGREPGGVLFRARRPR